MKRLFLLLSLMLVFILGATIAIAAPLIELPEEIPTGPVHAISFRTFHTLSYDELAGEMPIQIGKALTRADLEESIESLAERHIFAHIDLEIRQRPEGLDVEFLLVPELFVFELQFSGNSDLDDKQLRRLAGLQLGAPLNLTSLEEAKERIVAGYRREGHYNPKVTVAVDERAVAPQVIAYFHIDEGYRSRFGRVELVGEIPEELRKVKERFESSLPGTPVNEDNLKDLRKDLLLAVRNEGYLQASVEVVSAEENRLTGDLDLVVKLDARQPLTLIFTGNTVFGPDELLRPLRLDSRTVPFTPSAIQTLCKEIRRMYQTEGYFFAQCNSGELPADGIRRRYQVEIIEGRKVRLQRLMFEGNEAFTNGELKKVIETRSSGFLRPWRPGYLRSDILAADLSALEVFYREAGYHDVKIDFELTAAEKDDELNLTINITEGKLSHIEKLKMTWKNGAQLGSDSEGSALLSTLPQIAEGDPFQLPIIQAERTRLANDLESKGYPNAQVGLTTDEASHTVDLEMDPGVRVRVGRIFIAGNTSVSDRLVRRELQFNSGEALVPERLRSSEQALFRTGYFRSVEIRPADGAVDEEVEDISVVVSERDTGSIELGAAVNSEDGLHLFGQLGQRNLGGTGRSVVMGLDGFFKSGSRLFDAGNARIVFSEPHVFDSDAEWLNEAFAQYSIDFIDPFSYDRVGGSTSLRYPLTEKFFASFGLTAYYEHLFDVAPDVILGPDDSGNSYFSFLHTQLDFDRRDNPYNPRDGYRTVFQARFNSQALGADADFGALYLQQSFYQPLGKRLVWANNFRANYLRPFSDTEVVPLSQRIYLGGRNSLRGFSLYSIGPRGELGNIVGGDSSVNVNSELQYDLADNIVGVFFVDLGQAFLLEEGEFTGDTLEVEDLRYSPGIGFRYVTPIGPISAEVGFNVDRESGERWGRFNFSVGGAF